MEEFENKEVPTTKIQKIKKNLKDNRKAYVAIAATVAVTAVTTTIVVLVAASRGSGATAVPDIEILPTNYKGHHNTINNITYKIQVYFKTVSKYGNPLGAPGIKVMDVTDPDPNKWHLYETIDLVSKDLSVGYRAIRKVLDGERPDINGHVLRRLDDLKEELQRGVAERIEQYGHS